jgi:hypothetical protein
MVLTPQAGAQVLRALREEGMESKSDALEALVLRGLGAGQMGADTIFGSLLPAHDPMQADLEQRLLRVSTPDTAHQIEALLRGAAGAVAIVRAIYVRVI